MNSDSLTRRCLLPYQFLLAACILGVLAGCATGPNIRPEDTYRPPPPGAPVAFIKGSVFKEDGLFGSEYRGFATMIDLKSIPDAASRWSEAIALTPGRHTIDAEYRYSNFMARASMGLDAAPGVTYQVMIKTTRDATGNGRIYNDFWIVDLSTGNSVTPVYRRQATGGKNSTLFYINK